MTAADVAAHAAAGTLAAAIVAVPFDPLSAELERASIAYAELDAARAALARSRPRGRARR